MTSSYGKTLILSVEGGHRGFAFVEFKYVDDAKAAIDNMHMAELYGQVIKCNLARNYTLD